MKTEETHTTPNTENNPDSQVMRRADTAPNRAKRNALMPLNGPFRLNDDNEIELRYDLIGV